MNIKKILHLIIYCYTMQTNATDLEIRLQISKELMRYVNYVELRKLIMIEIFHCLLSAVYVVVAIWQQTKSVLNE